MIRALVVAGTYQQFLQWCHEHDCSPLEAVYVDRAEKLKETEGIPLHLVGTFYSNRPADFLDEVKHYRENRENRNPRPHTIR